MSAVCTKDLEINILASLLAYWTMDENVDNADRVDEVAGIHLLASNMTWTGGGKISNAARLQPGFFSDLIVNNNPAIGYVGNGLSFFGWVRLVTTFVGENIQYMFYGFKNAANVQQGFMELTYDRGAQTLTAVLNFGGISTIVHNQNLHDSAFHFFVFWYDPADNNIHLQVDNGSVDDGSFNVTPTAQPKALFEIFKSSAASDYIVDEYGIYGGVLSSSQRSALWNSGNGLTWPAVNGV